MYTRLPRGVPRCQHIKVNGTRCDSPALKGKPYCYFHFRSRLSDTPHSPMSNSEPPTTIPADGRQPRADGLSPLSSPPDLFVLEDANSIQYSLQWVLRRILDASLDRRQAALLLYGLQIAAANIKLTRFEPFYEDVVRTLRDSPQTTTETSKIPPPSPQTSPPCHSELGDQALAKEHNQEPAVSARPSGDSSGHLERAPIEQTRGESNCHLERAPIEQTRGESKDLVSCLPIPSVAPQPPSTLADRSEPIPNNSKLSPGHGPLATAPPKSPPRRSRPAVTLDRRMLASTPRAALSLMFQREVRRHLAHLDFPSSPESDVES